MQLFSLMAGYIIFGFVSVNAQAQVPQYSLATTEVYGQYEQFTTSSCTDEHSRPCVGATVKKVNGKAILKLTDFDAQIPLFETSNGRRRIVFNWENSQDGDCDDPGCWNLLGLSGVIYPKKQGNKYVPALKVFVKKLYPFPDEEGAPEGEVSETENYIKRK